MLFRSRQEVSEMKSGAGIAGGGGGSFNYSYISAGEGGISVL